QPLELAPELPSASGDLKQKLLADIRAQRERISLETLNRLANSKNLEAIDNEMKSVGKEIDRLLKEKSRPSDLTYDCLALQFNVLFLRAHQIGGKYPQSTEELQNKLFALERWSRPLLYAETFR